MTSKSTVVKMAERALPNPHYHRVEPHYRLYLRTSGEPVVVNVQNFDYPDYDADRFLSEDAYEELYEANAALNDLVAGPLGQSAQTVRTAAQLVALGVPVTREQAVAAFAATAFPQDTLGVDKSVAAQLRIHAFEPGGRDFTRKLLELADHLDGGVGPHVHHGCPDTTIPTAKCNECFMVLEAEVDGGALRSMFTDYTEDL